MEPTKFVQYGSGSRLWSSEYISFIIGDEGKIRAEQLDSTHPLLKSQYLLLLVGDRPKTLKFRDMCESKEDALASVSIKDVG